jgi:acetyl-CoA carboxylase beta subunit
VLNDPTYGGVSASYAMQADIRIAMSDARIGTRSTHMRLHTQTKNDIHEITHTDNKQHT